MNRIPVAQVFNLLYRRVALGKAFDFFGASDADADYKSAIQQSKTLRHMPTPGFMVPMRYHFLGLGALHEP